MSPWMSDSGDSRTATSRLHYVTPESRWQPGLVAPGFDAACGARVVPLWNAYDHALATRPRCPDCAEQERRSTRGPDSDRTGFAADIDRATASHDCSTYRVAARRAADREEPRDEHRTVAT